MLSPLQKKRLDYQPIIPDLLKDLLKVRFVPSQAQSKESLKALFPKTFQTPSYRLERREGTGFQQLKIGVVFSGGQAAGGHNVIAGLFDTKAQIIGFLDGPSGIICNKFKPIKDISLYRNQGGFDLLGSGRTKIEAEEQLTASLKTVEMHKLDGLVIIGGDDSNTNAAVLAEYFLSHNCQTKVVGVPKTIDGDLRSEDIELSFGFDSACKTYSEIIGNIAKDALSSKKYYHFIKLMGRSASHIALECALQTQPNITLIGEEKKTLDAIVNEISDLIVKRASIGKEYGIILIPEGLVEFIPELKLDSNVEKDSHGNVLVSQIQTEKLVLDLVKKNLASRGKKISAQDHFLGYEGRSCLPTNFDANYGYTLGLMAAMGVRDGLTGVICAVQNLKKGPQHWQMKAIPLVQLMHLEMRNGKEKPVIQKTLVDTKGSAFIHFSHFKKSWELEDCYLSPGPIQFFGDFELTDQPPLSL